MPDDKQDRPGLSVVIPTLGRDTLIATLESLRCVRSPGPLEVVVVGKVGDPRVGGELNRILSEMPGWAHLPLSFETGDSSRKKNAGFDRSRAPIVAFLDDDVEVEPDWAVNLLAAFDDPQVGLVSGPALIPEGISRIGRLAGLALASPAAGYAAARYQRGTGDIRDIRWSAIIGCNMAYRREAFRAMGQFDPAFWPGEEMIAAFKTQQAGYRIRFHTGACVYHYPRQSLSRFYRQIHGYGATRIRLIRAGVECEWTTLVPAAWVLFLLLAGVAAWVHPWGLCLLSAGLGGYALAAVAVTAKTLVETRRPGDAWLLGLIPVMHISYGLGEWIELCRPGRDLSER